MSSMPPIAKVSSKESVKDHLSKLAAAHWKTQFHQLSEVVLAHVFSPVPYAMTGEIASRRFSDALLLLKVAGISVPFPSLASRPLPKGATGMQFDKELHDDPNASAIPGVWTSMTSNQDGIRAKL
jgi:hypothetical protein